ncbi:F-box/FBD/LRR protein [Medicago truncatula]|uniref:F-box/FBD/LRR protein n=1 Tax=Medicago truncatula TaxID=3880 RepID=Q2HS88_MEDTR|nr:Leucine Rich Repeat, putative [Medicago truncatula]KEH29096.1 F-box/FBD/LRR protein [Medicago truncatula]
MSCRESTKKNFSLCNAIHLNIQSFTTISLPSLKILLIDIFGYVEVPMVNALLCGCPNIEVLDLKFLTNSLDNVCLPPTLKRLKIGIESKEVGPSLEINAPDLEYINIYQYSFSDVLNMKNLHNVIEASLDLMPFSYDFVVPLLKLLNNLSRAKHLVLSDSTTKWLLGEPRDLLFQEFCNLLHLDLTLPWFSSNSLLSLLHKCPILRVLKIRNKEKQSPILGWAPQPTAPNCLVSHLTFIEFKGFRGFSDEISFVEDVLQKGLVLKTVIIADITVDQGKKYDILK